MMYRFLIPSLYAWQIYGWKMAIGTYLVVVLSHIGLGLIVATRERLEKMGNAVSWTMIAPATVAIGLSAGELCSASSGCGHIFG